MRIVITIVLIFLISGCSVFKSKKIKTDINEQTSSSTKIQIESNKANISGAITYERKINSDLLEIISIYPRGRFTLSEIGQFEGEADSVRVVKVDRGQELVSSHEEVTDQSESNSTSISQEEENKSNISQELDSEVKKEPRLTSMIGTWVIVIFLVLAVLYFLRRFRQFPFR